MSKLSLFTLFLGSSFLLNCAANPFQQPPLIKKAIRKSLAGSDVAVDDLEDFIEENPDHEKVARHMLYAGELRRLQGDYRGARKWFERIVADHPTSEEKSVAWLGMAVIDYDSGKLDQIQILKTAKENPNLTPDSLNADRYLILYAAEEEPESDIALRYAAKAKTYGLSHPKTQARLESVFAIADEADVKKEDKASDKKEPEAPDEIDPVQFLELTLAEKNWEKAIKFSEEFLAQYPDSDHYQFVEASLERAKAKDPFQSTKVGVLLPLTGKYAPAAKAIRQSLEFSNAGRLNLVFYDTGWVEEKVETPEFEKDKEGNIVDQEAYDKWQEEEKTREAALLEQITSQTNEVVKKAVTQDGCAMLVGPLLKEVAPIAAAVSKAYQVPMISLSKSDEVLEYGEYIYRISIPVNQQVTALVDHSMDQRGWTKFVAMVPDNEYGRKAFALFQDEVKKKDGQVLRHVFYDPKATSFMEEARQLGLKPEKRPSEKEIEKDPTIDHPTMDFDAIFIPDNHRRLPSVAASLAFEEFSIGSFRINRHAEPTYAIGLNGWNNPSITDSQYLINGVFVDAYWAKSEKESVQQFVLAYKENFSRLPNMYDALSQDAMELAFAILQEQPVSRSDIKDKLPTVTLTAPVTGGTMFGADHDLARTLSIYTVKKDGIREWKPPEEETKD